MPTRHWDRDLLPGGYNSSDPPSPFSQFVWGTSRTVREGATLVRVILDMQITVNELNTGPPDQTADWWHSITWFVGVGFDNFLDPLPLSMTDGDDTRTTGTSMLHLQDVRPTLDASPRNSAQWILRQTLDVRGMRKSPSPTYQPCANLTVATEADDADIPFGFDWSIYGWAYMRSLWEIP